MMKAFKKLAGIVLSIAMVASLICVPAYADEAPAYTETSNTTETYANSATRWAVAPTITETIGAREKRNVALATSFWAAKENGGACSYSSTPTKLTATFTQGEGLLEFEAYTTTDGPIWSGTELEMLRIIPTDDAFDITSNTVVTGTIAIDWCGEKDMPFSVTITPYNSGSGSTTEPAANADTFTVTMSEKMSYAQAATGWNATPPTVTESIGKKERLVLSMCTSYWANVDYTELDSNPVLKTAEFTSGDGLLAFEVFIGAAPFWDSSECLQLRVTPTDAAQDITETTTVAGTISMYWCGDTNVPFSITLVPSDTAAGAGSATATTPAADAESFKQTGCTTLTYAQAATGWNVTPPTVSETINIQERMVIAMCTSYWANVAYTQLGATPVLKTATFTSGDGLLAFEVYIGAGPIWDGAECMLLRVTPTDAAQSLTEDTTVTGSIPMYWCGDTNVPFSFTLTANAGEPTETTPAADAESFTQTNCTSTTYANAATTWNATPPTVSETIGQQERMVIAMCTSYWANVEYTQLDETPVLKTPIFTSGKGLLAFEVYIGEGPIWDGLECMLLRVTPTDAAQELTENTTVTGTIPMYWCGDTSVPFSFTITAGGLPEYTETSDDTEDYARAAIYWGEAPMIKDTINYREKRNVALASSYWGKKNAEAEASYSATPTTLEATFVEGDGLLTFEAYTTSEGPIWSGTELEMLRIIPTDEALELTTDTLVTGTIEIDWCGERTMPFSIIVKAPDPIGKSVGNLYISAIVGDDITAVFDLEVEGNYDSAKFVASLGTDTPKTIIGTATATGYRFEYDDIYAQRMSDVITGQFIGVKEGQADTTLYTLTSTDGLSIATYCDLLLDEPSIAANQPLVTFLANMLEFGAASQTYKGYGTSALANTAAWVGTNKTTTAVADPGDIVSTKETGAAAYVKSASLAIGNKITAEFTIYSEDIDNVTVTVDDVDVTSSLKSLGSNLYGISKENIDPSAYDDAIVVKVSYNSTLVHTLEYSVNHYLYRMRNYNTKLSAYIVAIYNYGTAAEAYHS